MDSKNLTQSLAPAQDSLPADWREFREQHHPMFIESLLHNLPDCYAFWKDRQGRYLGCSVRFAEFVGLEDPEDILGKTNAALDWPLPVGMEADQWQELLEANDEQMLAAYAVQGEEFQFVHDEDSPITPTTQTLRFTQLDRVGDEGNPIGSVGFLQDVSRLRHLESLLKNQHDRQFQQLAQHSLQTANQLRLETETPLINLTDLVNHTLKQLPDFPEYPLLKRSVDSLRTVINGVKEDHRRTFGAFKPRIEVLSGLISRYVNAYASKPEHSMTLAVQPEASMACIAVEEVAFEPVFHAVISHARRFAGKDQPLSVSLSLGLEGPKIAISFNGALGDDKRLALAHARHFMQASGGEFYGLRGANRAVSLLFNFPPVATPAWLATEICLPDATNKDDDGNSLLLIGGDKTILNRWQQRIDAIQQAEAAHTPESATKPIRFSTMDTVDDTALFRSTAQRFARCLVSEEAQGDNALSGLALIEQCGIAERSSLLTDRYGNAQLQLEAQRLGVKLLPKECLPFVPLRRKQSNRGATNPALNTNQ